MQITQRIRKSSASAQVRRNLVRYIKEGRFTGPRLPSEDDISSMFGVSRITVRDALANLENSGYVSRLQGRGTVINRTICSLTGRISEGRPFDALIRAQNMVPSMAASTVKKLPITPEIKKALQTGAGEMYQVERLFLGNGDPLILLDSYLTGDLLDSPVDGAPTLERLQERIFSPNLAYDLVTIHPIQASAHLAGKLGLPVGLPMLMFETISMDQAERPLLVNHEFYHPDKIRFCEVRLADYRMNNALN